MAFAATTVWEVESGGSDSNGGGFDASLSGTDYSQQTTAQATGTVTSATVTVTATTGIFTSVMVGNYITDGTTWKEITAFTSSTIVTVDSAPSWTAASIKVGGCFATPGRAAGLKVAGNSVYIKAATYQFTTASTNVSGGLISDTTGGVSGSQVTRWEGYQTTRGDKGTKPILQAPSSGSYAAYLFVATGSYTIVDNIAVDGNGNNTAGLGGFHVASANYAHAIRLKAQKTITFGFLCDGGNLTYLSRCEATLAPVAGFSLTDNNLPTSLYFCESHGNTTSSGHGFSVSANNRLYHCLAYANAGNGFISNSIGAYFDNCDAYENTLDGFNLGSVQADVFNNCISWGNTGKGWNFTNGVAQLAFMMNCAGGGNSSNFNNIVAGQVENFVTLTADPFVAGASGNFALNNTANAGAACRAAGFPGVMPSGNSTGYLDIGAIQHQDSGGGGSVFVINNDLGM